MLESEGELLGSYRLECLVGEGAMGRVWAAQHVTLGRRVAVKVLREEHASNPSVIGRFFDEARAVNRIDHPHIVEIFDFVNGPPRVFCVMELLEGQRLSDVAPLPVQATIGVLKQICDALAAAHRAGVVHRDVKPENVFLTRRPGAPLYVKMLDFGVAKLTDALKRAPATKTAQGTLLGTPLYMSPEQLVGLEVDARSDVYAVGCLLYWMLTGRPPFDHAHLGELSKAVLEREPAPLPRVSLSGERVPSNLVDLAHWCLLKRREERPASMEKVLEALNQPARVTLVIPHRRPVSNAANAAGLALVVSVAGAWAFKHVRRAPVAMHASATAKKQVAFDVNGTMDPFGR
jgi:serine/threonine-protein kinase